LDGMKLSCIPGNEKAWPSIHARLNRFVLGLRFALEDEVLSIVTRFGITSVSANN
jgi:hypothetical protein